MANPIPNADFVNDLGFDDGRYVAVGMASERAAIWTSLGGLWTQNDQGHIFDVEADGGPGLPPHTDASNNVPIFAVAHGPGGWLAGGSASCGDCHLQPGGSTFPLRGVDFAEWPFLGAPAVASDRSVRHRGARIGRSFICRDQWK